MDPQVLSAVSGMIVLIFVILVVLVIIRIGARYIEYKKEGLDVPILLYRDLLFFLGLGLPFLGILFFRYTGIVPADYWWYPVWVIGSGLTALLGTAYWVYVEYFKIER